MDDRFAVIDKNLTKLTLIELEGSLKATKQEVDIIERLVDNILKEDIKYEHFKIDSKSLSSTANEPVEKNMPFKFGKNVIMWQMGPDKDDKIC